MRSAILLLVLGGVLTASGGAEESKSVAARIGENFLEELLGEAGIKKPDEGLGFAGSQHLGLEEMFAQTYSRFAAKLTENHQFRLIPTDQIATNAVYRNLLQKQGNQTEPLVRSLARDILQFRAPRSAAGAGIDPTRASTISIVAFAGFNGARGLAFANSGVQLINLGTKEAALLAKSLNADYLVGIKLAPHILKYEPMSAQAGTVSLLYRARVYNKNGQVIFDEKIPGDETLVTAPMRFVGYQLSFFDGLKMNLAKAFFLFPSDAQSEQLGGIEGRLLLDILLETHEKLAQRMIKR